MSFEQKVIIKGVEPLDVIRSFHDHRFVEFLTALQPVRITSWKGINNDMEASFSFWFFGWRDIKVVHKNYGVTRNSLQFEDKGLKLPFGLSNWNHHHIVESHEKGTAIIDKIEMDNKTFIKKYFVYPIMIFPVLIRRLTYKIWFYLMEGKTWHSLKRFKSGGGSNYVNT